ncbi:hypothetical protein ACLI1M_000829 [Corynebacterium sp. LaCa54]|uniref:hypothetical protein n=1 Tax=Corynebacterium sp. LaCa54 TaxID=3391428 RepID=UPI00398954BD
MTHFDENGYRVSTGQLFAAAAAEALNGPPQPDKEADHQEPKPGPRRPQPVPEAGTPTPFQPKGTGELFALAMEEALYR